MPAVNLQKNKPMQKIQLYYWTKNRDIDKYITRVGLLTYNYRDTFFLWKK